MEYRVHNIGTFLILESWKLAPELGLNHQMHTYNGDTWLRFIEKQ